MTVLVHHARIHRRTLAAVVAAVAAFNVLPADAALSTRFIGAWDVSAAVFLGLTWRMMARATPDSMRQRARLQDESKWVVLALTVGAASMSLFATGAAMHGAKDLPHDVAVLHVGLAAATMMSSWLVIHTTFTLHYAHAFFGDGQRDGFGLDFPGDTRPDYWDFMYFSLVIGMTSQVSDVPITARPIRRLAMAHGVLSFFFNTVILAITINIAAGLM